MTQAETENILQLCLSSRLVMADRAGDVIVMENYKMIDYDHSPDDQSCNAVVIDTSGGAEAIWTFEWFGELATHVHPAARETFGMLWSGIERSFSRRGVFWTSLVIDPTRLIDPKAFHVIATVQVSDGQVQHRTFMVPVGEDDLAFTSWLAVLATTTQPRPKAAQPSVGTKQLVIA